MQTRADNSPGDPRRRALLLAVSLMVIAFNLRTAVTSLGPVLLDAIAGLGLTGAEASLLTTIPSLLLRAVRPPGAGPDPPAPAPPGPPGGSLLPGPLAAVCGHRLPRALIFFMGLQPPAGYLVCGWLAPIRRSRGLAPGDAAFALSLPVTAPAGASLLAPSLAMLCRDQRLANVVAVVVSLIG